ncbi:MAG: hypothetical protein IT307_10950 [Chloroflexi bacterium]|nr:hypothetical protein [Chloroflexota bacterium]
MTETVRYPRHPVLRGAAGVGPRLFLHLREIAWYTSDVFPYRRGEMMTTF